jgi:DNA-binding MarR family transcriptional regulator
MSSGGVTERTIRPPQIGALLRFVWQRHQDELRAALNQAGFDDMRHSYIRVMGYPPSDGLRPSEVAARLQLSKQATNDLLRELEHLGYLTLEPDASDGRARLIRFTTRGWSFFELASQTSEDIGQTWAQALGENRIAQLHATLHDILALGSAPPRPLITARDGAHDKPIATGIPLALEHPHASRAGAHTRPSARHSP